MATAPVKQQQQQQQQQQPLHNFPVSLKWGPPQHEDPENSSDPEPGHRVGSRSARLHRISFTSCSLARPGPRTNNPSDKEEEESYLARPWKLRPRKQQGGGEVKEQQQPPPAVVEAKATRLRGGGESSGVNGENKEKKRKFWIALSREEIEEDVFVMTGSRPARRPRKRPKNIQKLLDSVFPGLWLVGTSADYYRVAETPVRR